MPFPTSKYPTTVLPCENGDRLLIYLESEYPRIVEYFLESKRLGDCQSISEYEARSIMQEEGFLFCEIAETAAPLSVAKGELEI